MLLVWLMLLLLLLLQFICTLKATERKTVMHQLRATRSQKIKNRDIEGDKTGGRSKGPHAKWLRQQQNPLQNCQL